MAKTLIAWAPIHDHNPVNNGVSTIPVGDKVDRKQVGDDWNSLIAAGVLRSVPYPKVKSYESPNAALLREANEKLKAAQTPYSVDTTDNEGVEVYNAED